MAVVYRFHAEQWLPYPVPLVFSFFANPANLPRLQPRWQKMRIEQATFTPPPPPPAGQQQRLPGIAAGNGSRLLLSARPFPFSPLRAPWEALIEDFAWDQGFCDVQVRGPFRSWRHCHSVEAVPSPENADAGTLVRDEVAYELPLGRLNPLADKLAAKNALAYTFRVRHKNTIALLERMTGGKR